MFCEETSELLNVQLTLTLITDRTYTGKVLPPLRVRCALARALSARTHVRSGTLSLLSRTASPWRRGRARSSARPGTCPALLRSRSPIRHRSDTAPSRWARTEARWPPQLSGRSRSRADRRRRRWSASVGSAWLREAARFRAGGPEQGSIPPKLDLHSLHLQLDSRSNGSSWQRRARFYTHTRLYRSQLAPPSDKNSFHISRDICTLWSSKSLVCDSLVTIASSIFGSYFIPGYLLLWVYPRAATGQFSTNSALIFYVAVVRHAWRDDARYRDDVTRQE